MMYNEGSPRVLDLPRVSYMGYIQVDNFVPDLLYLDVLDGRARGNIYDGTKPGQFILKMSLTGSYDKNTQGILLEQVVTLPFLPLIFNGVVFSRSIPNRIDLSGTVRRAFFSGDVNSWHAILDPVPR